MIISIIITYLLYFNSNKILSNFIEKILNEFKISVEHNAFL